MVKPIPEQYRKFYTPEQLAQRDKDIAFEKWGREHKTVDEQKSRVYDALLAKIKKYEKLCDTFDRIKEVILVEAFGTLAAGGLEIILQPNENDVVSADQILPYASLSSQQRYTEVYKQGQKVVADYTTLYNTLGELTRRSNELMLQGEKQFQVPFGLLQPNATPPLEMQKDSS